MEGITEHLAFEQSTLILEHWPLPCRECWNSHRASDFKKNNAKKDFYVLDAAMNDLIRPALYQA